MKNKNLIALPAFMITLATLGLGCSHSAKKSDLDTPAAIAETAEQKEIRANQEAFMNEIHQRLQEDLKVSSSAAVRAKKVTWTCTAVAKSGKNYARKNKDIKQAKLSAEKSCSAKKEAGCTVNQCSPVTI